MNQYHNHSRTPLFFHRLYWLFWTPAQIIMGAMAASEAWAALDMTDKLAVADFGYGIVTCLLMATYYIGFFKWKLYGWYALMAQLVINTVYAFVSLGVLWSDDRTFAVSLVIGTLIRCIPVGIYYYKRKPLFTRKGIEMQNGNIFFGGTNPQRPNGPQNPFGPQNPQNPYNPQNPADTNGQNTQNGQNIPQIPPFGAPWQNSYDQQADAVQNPQPAAKENFTAEGERIYYCPECGSAVKQSSVFCIHCGAKMK